MLCMVLFGLPACQVLPNDVIYVNGVASVPRELNAEHKYKFRFLERWRIGFSWYDHPFNQIESHGCHFERNLFRKVSGLQVLSEDSHGPLWQWHDSVEQPWTLTKDGRDVIFGISGDIDNNTDDHTLGVYNNGKLVKFKDYCTDVFLSAKASATLKIVKVDPAKGTDKWFENAERVTINGVSWSVIRKWDSPRNGDGVFSVEMWGLRIPDTPYLMTMEMNAWVKGAPESQSDEFNKIWAMFHSITRSVTLEPITPLVDQDKIILKENCKRSIPNSTASCLFNRGSLLVK